MVKVICAIMTFVISLLSAVGISIEPRGFQLNTDKLSDNITASTQARLEAGTLTGAHIIVNQNGETVFNKTFGKKSVNGEPLSKDAVYRIASMTKPVTAVAMLIEYERGTIDIYDDVAKYLPEFSEMNIAKVDENGEAVINSDGKIEIAGKAQNKIKVYQLVSHTNGIICGMKEGDVFNKYVAENPSTITLEKAVDFISHQPLLFEPGTQQSYSTQSYDVMARIIEKVSGKSYEQYLKDNIFTPLGMTDTTFAPSQEQFERMVAVHYEKDGVVTDVVTPEGVVFSTYPVNYPAAGAGLASTASDYLKFAQMLASGGVAADGTRILGEKYVRLMATPVPETDKIMNGTVRWGLGVRVFAKSDGDLPKGSFGWSGAYGTHFWIDPVNHIVALYMKNSASDGGAGCQTGNEFEQDVMASLMLKPNKKG